MNNNIIIIALIINVIISQVIASSVKNRQISSSKVFWLSFLFSPLVGMFAAMMSPEIKENNPQIINEGELDLPEYKDDDALISFFDKNLKYILIGLFILMVASGLYK